MEIYTIAYEYYHIIVFENVAEDLYDYQTDFYVSLELYERGNQSMLITDINADGTNELFAATSGTNTLSGDILAPGYFYGVESTNDVSQLSFENFNYFSSYAGGLRQINIGDADGDGNPNIYLAGHYNEAVFDWEFVGDDPLAVESFTEHVVFMDDTTDDFPGGSIDQGRVRVAKLFSGDLDNDGHGDLVLSSASFAVDKPTLFMIEHDGTLSSDDFSGSIPSNFKLEQNFPNPFNPQTRFNYTLPESGNIELGVYDAVGRRIYAFYNGYQQAGSHNALWTGVDQNYNSVPSGIYFYRLKTETTTITKKMVLTK
jgi:hypothetical protein